MPDSHPTRWIVFLLCGALSVLGCNGSTDGPEGEAGSLSLDLVIGDGMDIDEVEWKITQGATAIRNGTIDTSAPGSTISVEYFGLLPGSGYTIMLAANPLSPKINDATATCRGSKDFSVKVGQVTELHMYLHCTPAETWGGVRVNGELNVCATVKMASAAPLQTSVGNQIDLEGMTADKEGDFVKHVWSAKNGNGTIADPGALITTYTCKEVGDDVIVFKVSDDEFKFCRDDHGIPVTCVAGEGPECEADGDCAAGEVCEANECVPDVDCEVDGDCATGETCVDNECVAAPECAVDGDCATGETCVDNECVAPPECGIDGDCATGEICLDERCVSDPDIFCDEGFCAVDTALKAQCVDAFLTCLAGNPDEEECVVLALIICTSAECAVDGDCATGEVCVDNECVADVECTVDGDCATGEVCVDNECVSAPACSSPGDCIDGNPCTIGVCTGGMCSFEPVAGGSCDPGTGSGDGSCNDAGACVSNDECVADGECSDDDGNECTVPVCIQTGAPYVCDEDSAPADGNECDGGAGTCQAGVCEAGGPPTFDLSNSIFKPYNSLLPELTGSGDPATDCFVPDLSSNPGANLTGIATKCLALGPPDISGTMTFDETSTGVFDVTGVQDLLFTIDVTIPAVSARVIIDTDSSTVFTGTATGAVPGTLTMDPLTAPFNVNAAATGNANCQALNQLFVGFACTTDATCPFGTACPDPIEGDTPPCGQTCTDLMCDPTDVSVQVCPLANLEAGDNPVPLPGDPGMRTFPPITVGAATFELGAGAADPTGWYLSNPAPMAGNGTQWVALGGVQQ